MGIKPTRTDAPTVSPDRRHATLYFDNISWDENRILIPRCMAEGLGLVRNFLSSDKKTLAVVIYYTGDFELDLINSKNWFYLLKGNIF